MSLLKEAKLLLRRHRFTPKRRLGQNFLVTPPIFQLMSDYAFLSKDDVTLDIGAGLGFLTVFLAERCKSVLAVEFDAMLVKILREQLKLHSNVRVIEGDILKAQVPAFNKVLSVPPYNISSQLMLWLFNRKFECATLVLQKEFAQRLVAPIGSETYGWLTVITYYNAEVELLDDVPSWMFYPQPKVNSVIVRLKPRKPRPFTVIDEKMFLKFVQFLFSHRNRKVKNAFISFIRCARSVPTEKTFEFIDAFTFRDKRVRELAPEDFGALANAIAAH